MKLNQALHSPVYNPGQTGDRQWTTSTSYSQDVENHGDKACPIRRGDACDRPDRRPLVVDVRKSPTEFLSCRRHTGEHPIPPHQPPPKQPRRTTLARPADRRILAIAVPALGALIAEPLFLLADSAIVGRLGTTQLAALGVAGAILATTVNLFIFLAYGTTASVARRAGAGDRGGAVDLGLDAAWLAAGLGVAVAALGWPLASRLAGLFDIGPEVHAAAVTYLRWSLPGLPAMLLVLSQVGVLRGLGRNRFALAVAGTGAVVNALLNLLLVHYAGWGIAGSAIGTVLTQTGMAVTVLGAVMRRAVTSGRSLHPHLRGIRMAGRAGVPLLIRTVAIRVDLLVTTGVAAHLGAAELAAHQVAVNVWALLLLALDALAIAGQSLTGAGLGAGDVAAVRADTARMVRWGLGAGVLLGLVLLVAGGLMGPWFSPDPAVRSALAAALLVAAIAQPVTGIVCVLDGVLIGAGDGRFLAWAALFQTLVFIPAALAVGAWAPPSRIGLALLWAVFAGGWMSLRAAMLGWRARDSAWLVTGSGAR